MKIYSYYLLLQIMNFRSAKQVNENIISENMSVVRMVSLLIRGLWQEMWGMASQGGVLLHTPYFTNSPVHGISIDPYF